MTTTMKMSWLRESSVLWSEDWLRGAEGRRGGEGGKKDKEMGGGEEGGGGRRGGSEGSEKDVKRGEERREGEEAENDITFSRNPHY